MCTFKHSIKGGNFYAFHWWSYNHLITFCLAKKWLCNMLNTSLPNAPKQPKKTSKQVSNSQCKQGRLRWSIEVGHSTNDQRKCMCFYAWKYNESFFNPEMLWFVLKCISCWLTKCLVPTYSKVKIETQPQPSSVTINYLRLTLFKK